MLISTWQHNQHWISNGRDESSWQSAIVHCGSAGNDVAARLDSMATHLVSNASTTNTTGATAGATTGATEGATAPAPDATDVALLAHVQAHDAAMGARLDAAEASLRETIAALDTGLRVHVQEAVAQTQLALRSFGEKVLIK